MESSNGPSGSGAESVHQYTYARLHIKSLGQTKSALVDALESLDRRPLDGDHLDGDHYFAHLLKYEIMDGGRILVTLGPMWRVQSNDGPHKWHLTGWKTERWETTFEECRRLGKTGRSRARFKIPGGLLLILSRSTHDQRLINELTQNT